MTDNEIREKIRQIEIAISKTDSWKCRRDLKKCLIRLNKMLRYGGRHE